MGNAIAISLLLLPLGSRAEDGRIIVSPASEAWALMGSVTNLSDEKLFRTRGDYGDSLWPGSRMGRIEDRRHAALSLSLYW